MLDIDRAFVDASAATGAGPEDVGRNRSIFEPDDRSSRWDLRERMVAHRHDQEFRTQRLLGMPSGTLRLAPAALSAARHIEQALPRDIRCRADAEDVIFLRILEVDRLAMREHLGKGA